MSVEYTFKQGTLAGTTPQASIQSIVEKVGPIASNKIILDVGSAEGHAINSFKTITSVDRAIGVEYVEKRHIEAVTNFPDCELYNDDIENQLDIVAEADIIFMNNLLFPAEVFKAVFSSAKQGAIIIYNQISNSWGLKLNHGYVKSDIEKIFVESNNLNSEYHIIVKK